MSVRQSVSVTVIVCVLVIVRQSVSVTVIVRLCDCNYPSSLRIRREQPKHPALITQTEIVGEKVLPRPPAAES